MRRYFFLLLIAPILSLIICVSSFAQSTPPQTPHLGLYLPAHGSLNWDTWLNANSNVLDSDVFAIQTVTNYHTDASKHLVTASNNNDTAMQVTIPSGLQTASHTFATPYTVAPACVASVQGTFIPTTITYKVTSFTDHVTVDTSGAIAGGSGTLFTIICMGFPQ